MDGRRPRLRPFFEARVKYVLLRMRAGELAQCSSCAAGIRNPDTKKRRVPKGARRFDCLWHRDEVSLSFAGLAATYSPRA